MTIGAAWHRLSQLDTMLLKPSISIGPQQINVPAWGLVPRRVPGGRSGWTPPKENWPALACCGTSPCKWEWTWIQETGAGISSCTEKTFVAEKCGTRTLCIRQIFQARVPPLSVKCLFSGKVIHLKCQKIHVNKDDEWLSWICSAIERAKRFISNGKDNCWVGI